MLWDVFLSFWYVWVFFAAVAIGKWYVAQKRQARLAASGIEEIDGMDGRMFEECLAAVFRRLGYLVELTPYAGDWGGDLVLQKGSVRTVVQAKRYSKRVGVRAVQEVVAAKARYRCAEAMVVTNSTYTTQAQELARDNRVELWDRERLVQALLDANKNAGEESYPRFQGTPAVAPPVTLSLSTEGTPAGLAPLNVGAVRSEQTCILCQKPVSDKVAAFCQANPERFGGRIYCFEHQEQARRSARHLPPGKSL